MPSDAVAARLLEAGRLLVSDLDVDAVLDRLLRAAADITGARYAALGILDERRERLERFITHGIDGWAAEPPRGHGILGALISDPRPLRLASLSADPRAAGFPPGHPVMESFLGVPILVAGKAWGNLYLTEKAGGFTAADEDAVTVLAEWAAIAIDNARTYSRSEQRQVELEAMTRVTRVVGAVTDLERVLHLIAGEARTLAGAHAVAILLREPAGLHVAAVAGDAPEHLSLDALGEDWTLVPLAFRGRALGMLAVHKPAEQGLLESFAASAATAVATARSVEEQRVRDMVHAAEEERGRWARELHDGPLQHLSALRMRLTAATRASDEVALRSAIDEVVVGLQSGIRELRGLVRELRPAALDELGPAAAIEGLAQRIGEQSGLDIHTRVQLDGGGRQRAELETALYRLVEEALVNAARHSDAKTVRVAVEVERGVMRVEVRDDGRGFDPAAPRKGFGLASMQQRVSLLRGDLAVESSADGTTVTAAFPLS